MNQSNGRHYLYALAIMIVSVFIGGLYAGCQAEKDEAEVKATSGATQNLASYSVVPWGGGDKDQKYFAVFSLRREKDLKDQWHVNIGDRFGKHVGLFDDYVASSYDFRSPSDSHGSVYGRVGYLEDFLVLSSNYSLAAKRRSGACLIEYQVRRDKQEDFSSYTEWEFRVLPNITRMECDFSKKPRAIEEVLLFTAPTAF